MQRTPSFFSTFILAVTLSLSAQGQSVCVQTSKAQLRKGPGTSFPVTWVVGQHMPFLKVGEQNGWAQVKDLDGQTHWVVDRALTSKYGCAVVKAKQARLRTGPSLRSPASEPEFVDRYTPFRKVDRNGDWVQVRDDHKSEYWISDTNLWSPIVRAKVAF